MTIMSNKALSLNLTDSGTHSLEESGGLPINLSIHGGDRIEFLVPAVLEVWYCARPGLLAPDSLRMHSLTREEC